MAPLDRGHRGRNGAAAHAVAVSRGSLRRAGPGRLDCPLKLSAVRLRRPRPRGACWLALELWRQLGLDRFWAQRLDRSRKGTRWDQVLFVLVAYRLLAPGSEWRLHREWFERTALADLLGEDAGLAESHKLYRCHDRLLAHKAAVFTHLSARWRDLFNVSFDKLLYDLTSTYFESDPPFPEGDNRRYGHSRDHRSDCVPVIIALVVRRKGCRWPTRCCRAIPRTTRRSKAFSIASSGNTAKPGGSG